MPIQYLNDNGLVTLWNKIKSFISTNYFNKTELSSVVKHSQATDISGDLSAYLYKESGLNFSIRKTSNGFLNISNIICGYVEAIKGQTIAWNQLAQNIRMNIINATNTYSDGYTTSVLTNGTTQCRMAAGYSQSGFTGGMKICVVSDIKKYSVVNAPINNLRITTCWNCTKSVPASSSVIQSFIGDNLLVGIITLSQTVEVSDIIGFYFDINNSSTFEHTTNDCIIASYNIYNLTRIYNSGNEPSTPEQFEADYQRWFGKPLTYEPYDKGSLRNVMVDELKTVGFNQWDEQWEIGTLNPTTGDIQADDRYIRSKNFIPAIENTTYYIGDNLPSNGLWCYDSNKNFIGCSSKSNALTTTLPKTSFVKFRSVVNYGSTYNNDICINISDTNKNGTYESYWSETRNIPVTTLTGKLNGQGESVVIFHDGMKGVGDVHDEIYYVGGKTYAIKRVGRVDLGSLKWGYSTGATEDDKYFRGSRPNGIKETTNGVIICSKYITKTWGAIYRNISSNCNTNGVGTYNGFVNINESSYTDAATFKTAMSGVYLDYELATPLVYEVDDFTLPARYKVNTSGTEELLFSNDSEQISIIPSIDITYKLN